MRLTILGGGGFRTPLVYSALLDDQHEQRVTEVVLHDTSAARLSAIEAVLRQQRSAAGGFGPAVRTSTVLDEALAGADFVFCAMRVGGL